MELSTHKRRYAPSALGSLGFISALLASIAGAAPARGGWSGLTRIATGAGGISLLAQPPGDPDRMFVGTRDGFIRVFHLGTREFDPNWFLNLSAEVDLAGEGGLLGLAFHPDYQTNGKFYAALSADNGGVIVPAEEELVVSPYSMKVREYTASSDRNSAIADDFRPIIEWVKPYDFHNGGWIGFGPHDGNLYVTTGDGGGLYDAEPGHTPDMGNAQDLTNNRMGKVLRIDVNGDDFPNSERRNFAVPADNPFVGIDGDNEIFAYGLRNPWRASFDRVTGDLWLGDVGESAREEINIIPADSGGGQNFGWRLREGSDPTPDDVGGPPPARNRHPIYDYAHFGGGGNPALQGNSVVGGYLYRGPDPELNGQYVFADFIARRFWMFDPADPYGTVTNITEQLQPSGGAVNVITTFFEDSTGNLYVGTLTGDIYQLNTDAWAPGDFQHDGIVDWRDMEYWDKHFGSTGVPESYAGNADGDTDVDGMDFLLWQRNLGWSPQSAAAAGTAAALPEPSTGVLALGMLALRGARRVGTKPRRAAGPAI